MSDKTIRVSEDNWKRLRNLKQPGESFDDLVTRLTTRDKWSGFGALSDSGIADGMDEAHDQLEAELRRDAEEMEH